MQPVCQHSTRSGICLCLSTSNHQSVWGMQAEGWCSQWRSKQRNGGATWFIEVDEWIWRKKIFEWNTQWQIEWKNWVKIIICKSILLYQVQRNRKTELSQLVYQWFLPIAQPKVLFLDWCWCKTLPWCYLQDVQADEGQSKCWCYMWLFEADWGVGLRWGNCQRWWCRLSDWLLEIVFRYSEISANWSSSLVHHGVFLWGSLQVHSRCAIIFFGIQHVRSSTTRQKGRRPSEGIFQNSWLKDSF